MRTRTLALLFACSLPGLALCGDSPNATAAASQPSVSGAHSRGPETHSELPAAKALLEGHIKATGGLEALKAIKTAKTTGTLDIPAVGIKGKITIYQAAPNHLKMIVDLGQFGEQSSGYDGKVAWEIGQQGSQILEGNRAEQIKFQAQLTGFASASSFFDSMETSEETEFEGQPAYAVLCTKKGSSDKTIYFAKDSGLVIGVEGMEETPVGKMKVVTVYGKYKKVDKVQMPGQLTIKVPGMQQEISLDKIVLDGKLPEDAFDLPDSIQRKLK